MALFFDQPWFDERLAAANLAQADVARTLGITELEVAEMWKDQREISVSEIKTLALLLSEPEAEVKKRGGHQGSPRARAIRAGSAPASSAQPQKEADGQLDRIEALLEDVLKELKARD